MKNTPIPDELKPECEDVNLPMICICGSAERLERATALYERAKELLSRSPDNMCTDKDFMSRAVAHLHWVHDAEFTCGVDMWFGAYATVEKYVDCEHSYEDKLTKDTAKEEIAAWEAACPGEPECFVYDFVPVLKVNVECDRLEHGLAQLVIWFHENRKEEAE